MTFAALLRRKPEQDKTAPRDRFDLRLEALSKAQSRATTVRQPLFATFKNRASLQEA